MYHARMVNLPKNKVENGILAEQSIRPITVLNVFFPWRGAPGEQTRGAGTNLYTSTSLWEKKTKKWMKKRGGDARTPKKEIQCGEDARTSKVQDWKYSLLGCLFLMAWLAWLYWPPKCPRAAPVPWQLTSLEPPNGSILVCMFPSLTWTRSLQATLNCVLCRCTAWLGCIVLLLDCEQFRTRCLGKFVAYMWPARVVAAARFVGRKRCCGKRAGWKSRMLERCRLKSKPKKVWIRACKESMCAPCFGTWLKKFVSSVCFFDWLLSSEKITNGLNNQLRGGGNHEWFEQSIAY